MRILTMPLSISCNSSKKRSASIQGKSESSTWILKVIEMPAVILTTTCLSQKEFTIDFLLQFLSRVVMPLFTFENPHPQNDEIPEELNVLSIDGKPGEEPPEEERKPRF
jgi:hypothetical protein